MWTYFWSCACLCALACLFSGCESGAARQGWYPPPRTGRMLQNPEFASSDNALELASSLQAAGEAPQALAVLAEAYRRYPGNAEIASSYGRLALATGQDQLASRLLTEAIAANPQDWRALSASAVLDRRAGRLPAAREALIRASGLSSGDPVVLNNLGVSALLDGRAEEAAALFRQALASPSLKPAHASRIKRNLAVALAVAGHFDVADRLAGKPMPRALKNAGAETVAQFMGLGGRSVAQAAGWSARFADASQESGSHPR